MRAGSINVRRVGHDDLEAIWALMERLRLEAVIPFPELDREVMTQHLEIVGDAYFMALAERPEVVGLITAQYGRFIYNSEVFVMHDIFYVIPEARGSSAALRLVKAFENWASEVGARLVFVGVHTGMKIEVTGRFYEKLGYRHMGGNYMKEL